MHTTVKQGRIFKNPYIETFTKSAPGPAMAFYGSLAVLFLCMNYSLTDLGFWLTAGIYATGLFLWTFIEYVLHRFVLHIDRYFPSAKRFQYAIHGVHHEQPADKERLLMSPVPGTIIALILFAVIYILLGSLSFALMAGIVNGYLFYSYIHYKVHTDPNTKWFHNQWFHHALHHYKYPDKAFGVSTSFWDVIFGTMPPRGFKASARQTFSKN